MSTLGQLVANSLWFAYDALDHQKSGAIPKSQLKVLTQNIGVLLKINRRVENCITDYLSYNQLTFEQYLYFLTHEVLAEVDTGCLSYSHIQRYYDDLEWAFWALSRPCLHARHQPILSNGALFKVFRIFCLLGDRIPDKGLLTQVTLAHGEVEEVTRSLVQELGREFDQPDFDQLSGMIPGFTFPVFVTFLEGRYLQDVEIPATEAAVAEIYEMFIGQILEKGKVYQRLAFAPMWIPREIELVPWEIRLTKSSVDLLETIKNRQPANSLIKLNKKSTVFGIQDSPGSKPCRFSIRSDDKLLHLAAPDHRTKTRWLRSLEEAIDHSEDQLPYQRTISGFRKEGRAVEEERLIEEKNRRASQADIIEQTQAELEAERLARVEAEKTAKEETEARINEEKRVHELTALQKELEKLLEQETQAKRDEEIVRNLQARVLSEEWEKREELERLQREQMVLLEEEKKKRESFEQIQKEKEAQLSEAQKRLRRLEIERLKLDQELRKTREKIVMSERGKEIVEARMKVKERNPPARTYSLRPPRSEQRTKPLRSSSFNTQINSRINSHSKTSLATNSLQRDAKPFPSTDTTPESSPTADSSRYYPNIPSSADSSLHDLFITRESSTTEKSYKQEGTEIDKSNSPDTIELNINAQEAHCTEPMMIVEDDDSSISLT